MAAEPGERRLAAIMFTDIVGYTAAMAESEQLGRRLRERHSALVRVQVERYHGEWIEETGDESLSSFGSSHDAVNCALSIQGELRDDTELRVRIGIHSGDVAFEGGGVIGDGVNVAARIRPLAEPGGICISHEVQHSVRNQENVQTRSLGERDLKNVPGTVGVFEVAGTAAPPRAVSPSRPATGRRWGPLAGAALGVLLAAALGAWWLTRTTAPSPIRSIAVLPLENLSGDPEQEYFADGMTEALIGDLAKIGALRVISRTSVMAYKRARKPLPEIAHELDVDAVLEGTVVRAGDRVRITAQLIRAETDEHLWAESYERELQDVLALQAEVARSIASELRIELTTQERERLQVSDRVDPQAQDLYLQGRVLLNRAYYEHLREALRFFESAVDRDPEFANAHAALAEAYVLLADINKLHPQEAFPKARAAATRTIELDPSHSDARAVLGAAALGSWDWKQADRELRRAIELNPSSTMARRYRAWYLMAMGRPEEAILELERAIRLDPLYVAHYVDQVVITPNLRDDERTRRRAEQFLEMGWPPGTTWWAHLHLGLVHARRSSQEEAIAELERALAAAGGLAQAEALTAAALALAGHGSRARDMVSRLEKRATREWVPSYFLALVYAQLGEIDLAFVRLDQAIEDRDNWLPYLNAEPLADPLRSDARFEAVLRRIGFPES